MITFSENMKIYTFQYILADAYIQQRILDFVRPINSMNDIVNLQLAYGLLENESGIFLTRIKCTSRKDMSNGQPYFTSHFVVLDKEKSFGASYTSDNMRDTGELSYDISKDIPKEYEELIKQAFDYWRNWESHKDFEKEQKSRDEKFSLVKLSVSLRSIHIKELNKKIEAQINDRNKLYFEINSEEDAKRLFFLCDADYHHRLKKEYNEATVKMFDKFADARKKRKWVLEECREILEEVIDGDTSDLYQKLSTVSLRFNYWISATDDDLAEMYTRACKIVFDCNHELPLACVNWYLELFTGRFNPMHVASLIDMIEKNLKEKHADEYEKCQYGSEIHSFKQLCAQLRGEIAELSTVDNKDGFEFVETDIRLLDKIVEWYKNKYNSIEVVREELTYLNCGYGVKNEEVFLTSASEAADSYSNHSWDMYDFIAVFLREDKVVDFRCRRNSPDGSFYIDHSSIWPFPDVLMSAVTYFRNKMARNAFLGKCPKIVFEKAERHKELFSGLPLIYEEEMQRNGDNLIADTLKKTIS